jgi:hypothetical protein
METIELDALRGEILKLARLGHGSWRTPDIDRDLLARTPLVAARLEDMTEQARSHPDAIWEALDEALPDAISMLPADEEQAALCHFGYNGRMHNVQKSDLTWRKEEAAAKLDGGNAIRWYTSPRGYSLGMRPENYIIELVMAAIAGIDDPLVWVRARAPKAQQERSNYLIDAKHYQGTLTQAMIYATSRERSDWSFSPRSQYENEPLADYQRRFHLRACLDGPEFLHPDRYFVPRTDLAEEFLNQGNEGISDFVRRHVAVTCRERNPHVRLALRCEPDFYFSIWKFIDPEDHDRFFDDCLKRLDDLFGAGSTPDGPFLRGPDILVRPKRKARAGFISRDVPLHKLFDQEWWPAINSANDPDNWHAEYIRDFDQIFDAEYQGQEAAYLELRAVIEDGREQIRPKDLGV